MSAARKQPSQPIVLYTTPLSGHGHRVRLFLELLGLPYEMKLINMAAGENRQPAFLAKNPFGQVPVIDDDGLVVTESGAIVLYLARKSGKLMPQDLAGEAQVLRWSIAALNTIEVPVLTLWFVNMSGGEGSKPSEALRGWSELRLAELDGWLANRQFVATDEFTVADILMTHVLGGGTDQNLLKPHANVLAYRKRCMERDAWRRTLRAYRERVEAD